MPTYESNQPFTGSDLVCTCNPLDDEHCAICNSRHNLTGRAFINYQKDGPILSVEHVNQKYGDMTVLEDVNIKIRRMTSDGNELGRIVAFLGPSGCGKCLAPGTEILMFDGAIKKVEDIVVGDLLMGPDSRSRTVLSLGHGYDEMYKITPIKGEPHTVNSEHLLSLSIGKSHRSKARIDTISVVDYLASSKTYKSRAKLYRTGVDFPQLPLPEFDPYVLGLWLGDGDNATSRFTTEDVEVVEALCQYATATGTQITDSYRGDGSPTFRLHNQWQQDAPVRILRSLGVLNNKHIPTAYKLNSRFVRLEILAGLLDTDGHLYGGCFDFIQKSERLANDVVFLCRSLGLAAYVHSVNKTCTNNGVTGLYHRVSISGDVQEIPTRIFRKQGGIRGQIKNVLHTGFEVIPVGRGEYFGFQLDGDGLFLLGDFTVTHNTTLLRILAGLEKPTSGKVFVNATHDTIEPGMVGLVMQHYPLYRNRTIIGNLKIAAAQMSPKDPEKRAMDMLSKFGLSEHAPKYPIQLSGGQRQRIAVAQQLLCSDHYLLMDEPTAGLDPIAKKRVAELVQETAISGVSIIMVTHDILTACALADTIWLMGRKRNEAGNIVSGAFIVDTYDLIEPGLAWNPNVRKHPAYASLVQELTDRFDVL